MDLKSFYKKIDVDTIKSRLPPLPQIKIPKIKSRKIFKSSREDISQPQQPPVGGCPLTPQSLPPPSAFIDRTPTRISTVSSLMNIHDSGFRANHESELSTYRTASNFEAEHCHDDGVEKVNGNAATRFGDKCKKTYKDLSEFKIKNIFAKKTVVKKTEIEIDVYARQYELEIREELALESDHDDNRDYEFEFKEARRNVSANSFDTDSPPESDQSGVPTPLRPEMRHLQLGETPPLARRKNAINEGFTLQSRPQRSMSEESGRYPSSRPSLPPIKPNRSALWANSAEESREDAAVVSHRAGISKLGAFRRSRKDKAPNEMSAHSDSVWSLRSIRSRFTPEDAGSEQKSKKGMQAQESTEDQPEEEKRGAVPRRKPLPTSDSWDRSSEPHVSSPEGKFSNIKQSIKRLKQRKLNKENSEESEPDQQTEQSTMSNMSNQLRAGLKRLKMKERSISFDDADGKPPQPTATDRLRDWKKSLKLKRPTEAVGEDEESKPPPGRSLTLRRRLNQIRVRKSDSEDGPDQHTEAAEGEDQTKPKLNNLEKLEQARDKAFKKVNAQMQKIKMFQGKSAESPTESSPEKQLRRSESPEKRPRRLKKSSSDEQAKDMVSHYSKSSSAAWTSSKLMSESLESELEIDDIPEVLIHQDNSDQYESTLIIAMTRPAPPIPKSPIIKEIPAKAIPKSDWVANKNAISSFLEITPSPPPVKQLDISRGHFRKRSMDSNDSDSWIPDNFRNKSCASSTSTGLNKITENSEPWTVHSVFSEEKLYKTRSIDIFSKRDDAAFEDFEDEMKNVPVRRIATASSDSIDRAESTDDDDDYDNSSRITRLKRPSPQTNAPALLERQHSLESNKARRGSPAITRKGKIGNSRESLDANYDDISTDDDDGPPSGAPSPPPSFSPPPPPLPLRKPPKHIPESNDSMVRLAKPLVKQASLRRHFSEDIEPSDLGKVNKLISRFEKSPSEEDESPVLVEDEINANRVEEKQPKTAKPKEDTSKGACKKRPAPIPKQPDTHKADELNNNNNRAKDQPAKQEKLHLPGAASPETPRRQNLDNASIQSPRSEYGSPMGSMYFSENVSVSSEYGSPIGMTFPSKTQDQFHSRRRLSNRSSLRDDDTFYSFESDEENSFYSFGESSSSTRQTIEI